MYCPPREKIECQQFNDYLNSLGFTFIAGGDFNSKHLSWGSRQSNLKGKELCKALKDSNGTVASTGTSTYWTTNTTKTPDLMDFFIVKGVAQKDLEAGNIDNLSSDHSPIKLTIGAKVSSKQRRQPITTRYTDWNKF